MWPFMLAALATGARIIAYDGSPFFPDVRNFLRFISEQRSVHSLNLIRSPSRLIVYLE